MDEPFYLPHLIITKPVCNEEFDFHEKHSDYEKVSTSLPSQDAH